MGLKCLRLETGIFQPEALGMFKKYGFTEGKSYGDYTENPHSVFMKMKIA